MSSSPSTHVERGIGPLAIATLVLLTAAILVGIALGSVFRKTVHTGPTPTGGSGQDRQVEATPAEDPSSGSGTAPLTTQGASAAAKAPSPGGEEGSERPGRGDRGATPGPSRVASRGDRAGTRGALASGPGSGRDTGAAALPGAPGFSGAGTSPAAPPGPVKAPPAPAPLTVRTVSPAPPPPAPPAPAPVSDDDDDESDPDGTVADTDPASDRNAPVLASLRFDPPEVADGSNTMLMVQISDDLSGVRSVTGNVRSPSGAAILQFEARNEGGGDIYSARIPIPAKAETGNWYLANFVALDRANNSLIQSFTSSSVPTGGSVRVTSAESDSAGPEVRRVWVEKSAVTGGEKNTIRVQAEDVGSGVANLTGAFQNTSRSAYIRFVCRAGVEAGLWEGEVAVPANADCGEWTIQHVRIADNAGNIAYLSSDSPLVAQVGFSVSGQECDSAAPVLDRFEMTPAAVSNENATEIQVTAMVHDEGSGAVSVSGRVEGPVSTNGQIPRIFFALTKSASDQVWTGKIIVPQYAARGTWKVTWMRMQDRANNTREYTVADPVIAGAVFEVQ